jgi:integrase
MLKCKLVPPSARSPFWRIRGGTYPHNGQRIDTTTGTTSKREAEEIFTKFQRDLLNGVLGKVSRTFCDAAISYIEARKPIGSQRQAIVGRVRKSDGEISPCLVLDIGECDCREITQETVNQIRRRRFRTNRHGKPYKDGTVVRELIQPLTAVLNYAHQQGWCDKPGFVRPKFNDQRSEYVLPEEAARILRAASPNNREWYLFSMLEGTRASETLDLAWKDCWVDTAWAVVRDTKDNDKDRGIALHPQIIEMLRRVPEKERVGKVFKTSRGKSYAEAEGGRGYKTGWKATMRRAGISRDLRVHDLRHTFGTLALTRMPTRMIELQMGHADPEHAMHRRYVHVPNPELIEAVGKLPWLDCPTQTYNEWAHSGFGGYAAPGSAPKHAAEPEQPATIKLSGARTKGERAA